MYTQLNVLSEVVVHLVSAFVAWAFQTVVFVWDRKKVCGSHFPRDLSQGVRMGHVAAMTTEPL